MRVRNVFTSRLMKGAMAVLFIGATVAQSAPFGFPGFYAYDYTTPALLPRISGNGNTNNNAGSANSFYQAVYANSLQRLIIGTAAGYVDNRSNGNLPQTKLNDANVNQNMFDMCTPSAGYVGLGNPAAQTSVYSVTQDLTPNQNNDLRAYAACNYVEYH